MPQSPTPPEKAAAKTGSRANLTAVVAVTPSGAIGLDGDMPWRLGSDLRRFKKLTMGGVLIMGRKTFDSIGRPLPGRKTVVITRNPDWSFDGVTAVTTCTDAVLAAGDQQAFIVGGAQIYDLMLPLCGNLYLTRVWSGVRGDTNLQVNEAEFQIQERTRLPATDKDSVPTEFLRMVRRHIKGPTGP